MSERSDEYEVSIDVLPPVVDSLGLHFDYGNHITGNLPIIDIPFNQHPEERKTDNIVAPTRLGLLINTKVKAIFDALSIRNIQYFSVSLLDLTSREADKNYFIANVVGKYACVDQGASEVDYFDDGDIEFIDKLVLSLDKNIDYGHIFRLAEFPPVLVISDALKQALEDTAITGFKIYKPEEFSL